MGCQNILEIEWNSAVILLKIIDNQVINLY